MNNSKLVVDFNSLTQSAAVDNTPQLREREGELMTIIEALQGVQKSQEWSTLKRKVFDSLPITLTKELESEARKEAPDTLKLNRLAGQLKWAEKFSDLHKLEDVFRVELTNIRKLLHGTTEKQS